MLEFRVKTILQWNPVNVVTNGLKEFGRFNGVADFLYNYVLFNKLQECNYRVP